MNCQQIQIDLPDYARGNASPEVAARVAGHLAACPGCARMAESYGRIFAELDRETIAGPGPAYWPSIVARVHERIERRSEHRVPAWLQRFVLPASAALVVLLIGVRGLMMNGPEMPGSIGEILSQLPAADVERLQEQADPLLEAEDPVWAVETTPSDKELLAELIPADEQAAVYRNFDPETLVEGLSDQESTQLVALLEQQTSSK